MTYHDYLAVSDMVSHLFMVTILLATVGYIMLTWSCPTEGDENRPYYRTEAWLDERGEGRGEVSGDGYDSPYVP